ncbi:MAG TPA: leucyl aminopeptidase [Candidatus Gastranaerophilales bacterium]|nr:leucyl aminopeptidase [Candidatus Gastranaerophilales bacterium]
MEIKSKQGSLTEIACDVLVVNLFEDVKTPGGATGTIDKELDGLISSYVIKKEGFKGKLNEMYVLPTYGQLPADKVLIVGLGKLKDFNLNKIREISSKIIKKAKALKSESICSILHGAGSAGLDAFSCAQMIAEGSIIGNFSFDKYKTKKEDNNDKKEIKTFEVVELDASKQADIKQGIERGRIIGNAVNFARNLIHEPACEVTPSKLAETALSIEGIECKILEKEEAEKMGMGAYLAVARGSCEPPKFIYTHYKPSKKPKKKLAIVGKGITFDSGGLDLKSAEGMRTMKQDMSGAAATLGIMQAVAALKPDVEIHGIIASCENMPGSKAYKPGDVLRAMNGKTIEVDNTDAEGRLTLADALCYAAKLDVEEIVDIATLTGACSVALGQVAAGIMGNNQEFINALISSGEKGGEKFWQLPLFDEYKDDIKSDIADMKNSGGRYAGASTAGMLLKEFVSDKKWAHIDIAGVAYIDKEIRELSKGATGAGVRAVLNYILSL